MKALLAALLLAIRCGPPPDKLPALERCRAGWGAARRGAGLLVVADACADLYAAGPCRDSWRALGRMPLEERAPAVVTACRRVYCPRLPAPLPAACARTDAPAEEVWGDLDTAILAQELGLPRALAAQMSLARLVRATSIEMATPIAIPSTPPPASPARPSSLP